MSVTFAAEGLLGGFVPHDCDDLCADYLPAGHTTCPGDWREPGLNLSNSNAYALMHLLGLEQHPVGTVPADDLRARIELARHQSAEAVRPTITLRDPGLATITYFGVDSPRIHRWLDELEAVAVQAASLGVGVGWS